MRRTTINARLGRIEHKCDQMAALLTKLNKLVRGQVIDSLIDTMRREAIRMRNISRAERERSDELHG